jgi:hypothetical protein
MKGLTEHELWHIEENDEEFWRKESKHNFVFQTPGKSHFKCDSEKNKIELPI